MLEFAEVLKVIIKYLKKGTCKRKKMSHLLLYHHVKFFMYPSLINAGSLGFINVELDKINKTIPFSKKIARVDCNNFNTLSSIKVGNMLNELAFIN